MCQNFKNLMNYKWVILSKFGLFKKLSLTNHLIQLFMDFQNIYKLSQSDKQNQSYGLSKIIDSPDCIEMLAKGIFVTVLGDLSCTSMGRWPVSDSEGGLASM